MKKYLEYFNVVKLNLIKKNKFTYLPNNRKAVVLCKIFTKYNVSIGYRFIKLNNKNIIKLYLNFANNKDFLKNLCKPTNLFYVKHFFLKKYHAKHVKSIYILSTPKGIINSKEAEKYKVGGILMFKLN